MEKIVFDNVISNHEKEMNEINDEKYFIKSLDEKTEISCHVVSKNIEQLGRIIIMYSLMNDKKTGRLFHLYLHSKKKRIRNKNRNIINKKLSEVKKLRG